MYESVMILLAKDSCHLPLCTKVSENYVWKCDDCMYQKKVVIYNYVWKCKLYSYIPKETCHVHLRLKVWGLYCMYQRKVVMYNDLRKCNDFMYRAKVVMYIVFGNVMILCIKRRLKYSVLCESVIILCTKKVVMCNYVWKCDDFITKRKWCMKMK